jgi:hypothetical protein
MLKQDPNDFVGGQKPAPARVQPESAECENNRLIRFVHPFPHNKIDLFQNLSFLPKASSGLVNKL